LLLRLNQCNSIKLSFNLCMIFVITCRAYIRNWSDLCALVVQDWIMDWKSESFLEWGEWIWLCHLIPKGFVLKVKTWWLISGRYSISIHFGYPVWTKRLFCVRSDFKLRQSNPCGKYLVSSGYERIEGDINIQTSNNFLILLVFISSSNTCIVLPLYRNICHRWFFLTTLTIHLIIQKIVVNMYKGKSNLKYL
jgi:hypothetical protein